MAGEEVQVVRLRNDFYRDGFYKVLLALAILIMAIVLLTLLSVYLFLFKPPPVNFKADNEWRLLPPVPLDQPYLTTPDLIQWVTEALPASFNYDFINYTSQLKDKAQYFTPNGWKKFLDQINTYANYNDIQTQKLFLNASAAGAPFVLNQGLLEGKYGWWVQMPIIIRVISIDKNYPQHLVIQALVVRVPTLNNLDGVGIDNIIVSKGKGEQVLING